MTDQPLYEHLRDLRNKLANRNHVEPCMILTDRALRGLASIRPKSLAEAEGIPGIGPVKLHAAVQVVGLLDVVHGHVVGFRDYGQRRAPLHLVHVIAPD